MLFMHIGLHKTGTTFLQKEVFPKWRDLNYIEWPNLEHFLRMNSTEKYLVSREGLSGLIWAKHEERDRCIKRLSELFPEAKILISFRRHDKYIISSYKQFLQKGGTLSFKEFFDIKSNLGFQKREDLIYRKKLESIEKHFKKSPFVFLQEELSQNLETLLLDMEKFFDARAPKLTEIRQKFWNRGVDYYNGKLLRMINQLNKSEYNPQGRFKLDNYYTQYLKIDPATICQRWLSFLPRKSIIEGKLSEEIRAYYEDDWNYICACSQRRKNSMEEIELHTFE